MPSSSAIATATSRFCSEARAESGANTTSGDPAPVGLPETRLSRLRSLGLEVRTDDPFAGAHEEHGNREEGEESGDGENVGHAPVIRLLSAEVVRSIRRFAVERRILTHR